MPRPGPALHQAYITGGWQGVCATIPQFGSCRWQQAEPMRHEGQGCPARARDRLWLYRPKGLDIQQQTHRNTHDAQGGLQNPRVMLATAGASCRGSAKHSLPLHAAIPGALAAVLAAVGLCRSRVHMSKDERSRAMCWVAAMACLASPHLPTAAGGRHSGRCRHQGCRLHQVQLEV